MQIRYEGESPDEVALVQGAARLGCVLFSRDHSSSMWVVFRLSYEDIKVLCVLLLIPHNIPFIFLL